MWRSLYVIGRINVYTYKRINPSRQKHRAARHARQEAVRSLAMAVYPTGASLRERSCLRKGRITAESGDAGWGRTAWSQTGTVLEGTRL